MSCKLSIACIQDIARELENETPKWKIMGSYDISAETLKKVSKASKAVHNSDSEYLERLFRTKCITEKIYLCAKAAIGEQIKTQFSTYAKATETLDLDELRAPKSGEVLYTLMQIESLIHDLVQKTKEQS